MQEKILWADEIVLVFPIWWGDMPAIMKNWMDCNFMSGFAFKYEK
jgi:NAD(P)H dehydrogenase (quinone)